MKLVNRFFMILVALCLVCPGISAVVNPKPFVIPELKEWKGAEGAFVPTEATKIVCPANQPELLRIARMLAMIVKQCSAINPKWYRAKAEPAM